MQISNSTERTPSSGELVLWQGRPRFKPYLASELLELGSTVQFLLIVSFIIFLIYRIGGGPLNWTGIYLFFGVVIARALFLFFWSLIRYRSLAYSLTKQSVLIRKGHSRNALQILDRSRIKQVVLKESRADKINGTGTIQLHLGEMKAGEDGEEKIWYSLRSVPDPQQVLRLL